MNTIQAVILSDLDGTLLEEENSNFHPKDAELLKQDISDVLLVLASGRGEFAIRRALHRLGLFNGQAIPLPIISHNGAAIFEANEKLCSAVTFSGETQQKLIHFLQKFPDITIHFQDPEMSYELFMNDYGRKEMLKYDYLMKPIREVGLEHPFCKVLCLSEDPAVLSEVEVYMRTLPIEFAYSMPTILEITPHGVNKRKGAEILLKKMGLEGVPVFAAGNGCNDLPMLKMADFSFTPNTSPEEIKSQVDFVIDTRIEGMLTPILRKIREKDLCGQVSSANPVRFL
jgi:Cof subfamily protein (haloacid dehalogenase superfamily)